MTKKNSVAPMCMALIISDSQRCNKSQATASVSYPDLCSKVLKNPALKDWKKLFASTLRKSRSPGRKQRARLEAIALRLGYSLAKEGGEA